MSTLNTTKVTHPAPSGVDQISHKDSVMNTEKCELCMRREAVLELKYMVKLTAKYNQHLLCVPCNEAVMQSGIVPIQWRYVTCRS